jgi:hypothetical protein
MKQKFLPYLILILALGLLVGFPAQAQEQDPIVDDETEIKEELNNHPELNLNEDKILISEPDQKSAISHPASKETASPSKTTKSKSDKGQAEEDDDALSFNFLYYIIQKFKYSDIVDD